MVEDGKNNKEDPLCPRFTRFVGNGGICSAVKYDRGEGNVYGSCSYCGNPEQCLKESDPEFRSALVLDLLKHSRELKHRGNYFESITKEYTDPPKK